MVEGYEDVIPAVERILLITWLLKDFGWMSTNIFLAWPFGTTSVLFHFITLIYDPRPSFWFYNVSLVLWVAGNWLWMTIELCTEPLSSDIHWGPHVPVTSMSKEVQRILNGIKIVFFLMAAIIQCLLYISIYFSWISPPQHQEEDSHAVEEVNILFYRIKSFLCCSYCSKRNHENVSGVESNTKFIPLNNMSSQTQNEDNEFNHEYVDQKKIKFFPTAAVIEFMYIFFWILKDLLWSLGSGDIAWKNMIVTVTLETIGLFIGLIAFLSYTVTAFLYRRNIVDLLDCFTVLLWIAANYVWMVGEFFLRYQNLQLDDLIEGNDRNTRILSTILFSIGITLQIGNIVYISNGSSRQRLNSNENHSLKYNYIFTALSPFSHNENNSKWNEEEEENEDGELF